MFADTMEPIFRITVVRFAPVHDAVNKRAIGCLNVLRDAMGFIEMIVPQQHQRAHEFLVLFWQPGRAKENVEGFFQFHNGFTAEAFLRSEGRQFFCLQQRLEVQILTNVHYANLK